MQKEKLEAAPEHFEKKQQGVNLRIAYALTFGAVVATALVFAFQSFYPALIGSLADILAPVYAGVAFLSSFYTMRRYGFKLDQGFGRTWFLFTGGIASWLLGEISWAIYVFFLNVPIPYPSVADIFYIAGYPLFFSGLYFYVRIFASALSTRRIMVSAAAIGVSAAAIITVIISPAILSNDDLLAKIFDLSYPSLDLMMLSGAILGFAVFFGGTIGKSWLLLIIAIIFDAAGDLTFGYTSAQGTYYNGSFVDLLFLMEYLIFALAFFVHRKEL